MRIPPPSIGDRFGRWTVTGESFRDFGHSLIPCRCDCGIERSVFIFALRNGRSGSCGCLKREQVTTLVVRTRWADSHGRAAGDKDPLYRLWLRICKRCYNPQAHNYHWYGGRDIQVWDGWRGNAGAFIEYIEKNLGPCPKGMSLDRIDNERNYEPGNIRWATAKEQAVNRRKPTAG